MQISYAGALILAKLSAIDANDFKLAGHLIVGHIDRNSAIVWFRGSRKYVQAYLSLNDGPEHLTTLSTVNDYTAVHRFKELEPGRAYKVKLRLCTGFAYQRQLLAKATFKTAPAEDAFDRFSFLLGSCNLSVVAINHLIGQALQLLGFFVARQSLKRVKPERTKTVRPKESSIRQIFRWLARTPLGRWIAEGAIWLGSRAVFLRTGGKWPDQPVLRSPFLKLEALFAGTEIRFRNPTAQPIVGQVLRGRCSNATGILAFAPVLTTGNWPSPAPDERNQEPDNKAENEARQDGTEEGELDYEGIMILVQCQGKFKPKETLLQEPVDLGIESSGASKEVATVMSAGSFRSNYSKPAFTIHAGDQIYFDFPNVNRVPDVESYRAAYDEAWFEDRYQRSLPGKGWSLHDAGRPRDR